MTGKAFLKRLSFQLDFMMPEDRKTVLSYYENKLSKAADLKEESVVEMFGSPESIAKKLRKEFSKRNIGFRADLAIEILEQAERSGASSDSLPSNAESDLTDIAADNDGEIIFSRQTVSSDSPEYIHSLENNDIPSLYGEKVIIEDRKQPIEEIPLEPLDKANGLTPEEIEMAKAKTLKKADEFETDQEQVNSKSNDDDVKEYNSDSSCSNDKIAIELDEEEEVRSFPGLFKKILGAWGITGNKASLIIILFSLVASPLILSIFGLGALIYAFLMAFSAVLAVISFALIAGLLVAGVIELVYGIAMLFDVISVALIELGLGTVLFSFVVAISAMIYEFLFGILPRTVKWLTKKFIGNIKLLFCYLYGGNA